MAWPAPVPVLPLDDQTRFELLDATTPNDLEGSNLLDAGQEGWFGDRHCVLDGGAQLLLTGKT